MGKFSLWIRAAIGITVISFLFQQSAFAITANATASPSTIQQGQTSQLNCTGSGGSGTYYYTWSSVAPGFISKIQNPVVAPNVTTTYTCMVYNGGQYAVSSVTVIVTASSGLTATATATPPSITAGASSQLNCEPVGGSGNYTYAWTSSPAGFTSTLKNPVVTPAANTTYTCVVTSGTLTATASAVVTVVPLLNATLSATPQTINAGQSSQLDCTPTGGTGTYTYAWTSDPAGFTSTTKNPVVTPADTTWYICTITSGSQNIQKQIRVNVNGPVSVAVTATPTAIIAGQTSQLNANPSGGTGTYTYAWTSVPAGFTSILRNPVVSPTVNTTYTCVVTSGSATATGSASVTVTPLLTAAATATPPTIVLGQTSQLNCNPAGGTGTYTYSWTSNPAGFTSTQKNPIVSPAVTTVYTCAVNSGTQNVTSNVTVTVTTPAGLSATATATPGNINQGQSSSLNCNPSGGNGTYNYSWVSAPPGFTSTQKSPVVTPAVNTTYTCTVTSGTQSTNAATTVTVNTIPGLTATASATPPDITPGQSSTLNCTATGGNGTYTYSWTSNPAGFTSTQQSPVVSPAVTTVYTCTVTSGTQTANATTTVRITTTPTLTVTTSANPSTIQPGQSSQLSCTATGGTGIYIYSWTSVPAGFTSSQQNPVVTPSVNTTYTCVVTSGTQTGSSSVTVMVNVPGLTATATATPSTIAKGQSSQLNCNPTGGTGNYSYLWTSSPAGFTSTQKSPVVTPLRSTTYTVTVNDGSSTATASVKVKVGGSKIIATLNFDGSNVCTGENVHIEAIADGGTGTYTYSWTSLPEGFVASDKSIDVIAEHSMRLICEISDGDTTATTSTDIVVTEAPIVFAGNDTVVPEKTEISLYGTASNHSSVAWTTDGDGTFSDPSSVKTKYTPGQADLAKGSVTLQLTANAAAPCFGSVSSTMELAFTTATIVPEPAGQKYDVTVYPNPTPGTVHVRFTGNEDSDGLASVHDLSGKVLDTRNLRISEGGEISFDLSIYPKGIYFITIESGSHKQTHKVILK